MNVKKSIARPSPFRVKSERKAAGLTQTEAGELVHSGLKNWQNWESPVGSRAHAPIPLAVWELFLIKTVVKPDLSEFHFNDYFNNHEDDPE